MEDSEQIIGSLNLDFSFLDRDSGEVTGDYLDALVNTSIVPAFESVASDFRTEDINAEILEIDLGTITEQDIPAALERALRDKFEALSRPRATHDSAENPVRTNDSNDSNDSDDSDDHPVPYHPDDLMDYLEHLRIPWTEEPGTFNPTVWLDAIPDHLQVRENLVNRFGEAALMRLILLLDIIPDFAGEFKKDLVKEQHQDKEQERKREREQEQEWEQDKVKDKNKYEEQSPGKNNSQAAVLQEGLPSLRDQPPSERGRKVLYKTAMTRLLELSSESASRLAIVQRAWRQYRRVRRAKQPLSLIENPENEPEASKPDPIKQVQGQSRQKPQSGQSAPEGQPIQPPDRQDQLHRQGTQGTQDHKEPLPQVRAAQDSLANLLQEASISEHLETFGQQNTRTTGTHSSAPFFETERFSVGNHSPQQQPPLFSEDGSPSFRTHISDAGLVLIHPFIQRFFTNLALTDEQGRFLSGFARINAIHLLREITGSDTPHFDHNLLLEKILCGIPLDEIIPLEWAPDEEEIAEIDELLDAIRSLWAPLKNSSIQALQRGFLQRPGSIEWMDGSYLVRVESSAMDILLDDLPWETSIIVLPWLENPIIVEWQR